MPVAQAALAATYVRRPVSTVPSRSLTTLRVLITKSVYTAVHVQRSAQSTSSSILWKHKNDLQEAGDARALVEEVVRTRERDEILHFCMQQLNSDYREALYLVYFEGMSYRQTSKIMGKNVKQITNMVYRGKIGLRKILEKEGITGVE